MGIHMTTIINRIFTIPFPLSTDHLLVSRSPRVCPLAKVRPISQSNLPFKPKSIKAALAYTTIITALMTFDLLRIGD